MSGRELQLGERIAAAGSKGEPPPNLCRANAKHFQISVVPMPSFSKDCFGGFVGFQRVTIDPNQKSCIFQIFDVRMSSKQPAVR
jgi:hypothetical protein